MSLQYRWKSRPSCPIEVVARTIGQKGELNPTRTESRESETSFPSPNAMAMSVVTRVFLPFAFTDMVTEPAEPPPSTVRRIPIESRIGPCSEPTSQSERYSSRSAWRFPAVRYASTRAAYDLFGNIEEITT